MSTDPTPDPAASGDARMYRLGQRHARAALEMGYRDDATAAVEHYERKPKLTAYEQGMLNTLKDRTTGETR